MPNICGFGMIIKGKKENREKLVSYLQAHYGYDYNYETKEHTLENCSADKHFFRIFDADAQEEDENTTYVSGSCAWSVYSCMFHGNSTYFDDYKDAKNRKCTNMCEATKELDLVVEIYSEEPGLCFMEHFIVDKGEWKVNECVDWEELYDEDGEPIYDEETGEQKTEGGLEWKFTI